MSRDVTLHIGEVKGCPLDGQVENPSFDAMVNSGEQVGDEARIRVWILEGDTKQGLYYTMDVSQYEAMNTAAQTAMKSFAERP